MNRLHSLRLSAISRRNILICRVIRLESALERITHNTETFFHAYDQLSQMPLDLILAIEHACMQDIARQNEGGYCQPVEVAPDTFDELIYIINCAKISLP